jgi:hypothetical protein
MRRSGLRLEVHPHLVDTLMELYCDWRTECSAVRVAYEHFADADDDERAGAHAAYSAALDREHLAADTYAAQVRLISAGIDAATDETRVEPGRAVLSDEPSF